MAGVELRVKNGAPRGGFGFFGRDVRQIQDEVFERLAVVRVGEPRFECRKALVERGSKRVELVRSGVCAGLLGEGGAQAAVNTAILEP